MPDVEGHKDTPEQGNVSMRAIDPVCGWLVDVGTARQTVTFAGTVYYFCAPTCRNRFAADPETYVQS